jgi:hypothetical protein
VKEVVGEGLLLMGPHASASATPFALSWSKGLHRQRPGFDGLSLNGGGSCIVWRALPIPHPFRLSLSKAGHGLCLGFDGLSPNGGG